MPPTHWPWRLPTPTPEPWPSAPVREHRRCCGDARAADDERYRCILWIFAMIGRLKGILIHKQPPWLVIDVHGVGYELEAPMSTFYDLPELGREVSLFTHYAQKEDSVSLYGFLREDRKSVV